MELFRPKRGKRCKLLLIVPSLGELIYASDTREIRIGDGISEGGLFVGYLPEAVQGVWEIPINPVKKKFEQSQFNDMFGNMISDNGGFK